MSPASEVVGRESELAAIRGFLDGVPTGPAALFVVGEPGIGKTTLWNLGLADAVERGLRLLSCRPVEAEMALPFAALGDLLEHVPDEVLGGLPDPQREALEIALLRVEAKPGSLHGRTVGVGVLGAIRALAEASNIVVAIDDVQWLDAPSADALAFAARRLRDEPVRFLLARRADPHDATPPALESAFEPTRVTRLDVGPLDLPSLDRLLRSQLDRQFLRPALVELRRVSGGNPFFALELGRALLGRDVSVVPGDPLPLPATLNELVRERLEGLPPAASDAALVVSALSRPTVALVSAALEDADAPTGLEGAEAAGIVEVADGRIRFTHPLLGSVVYAQASQPRRHQLHARLAMVVDDPDERARHLALAATGPDAAVAAALESAARRARARGAPQSGAALWEQARRLTPTTDGDAWRRAVEAAECHLESGDTERARIVLEEVVAELPPGHDRAVAITRLAWVEALGKGFHVGADLFRSALAEIGDDPAGRAEIERGLAWSLHELGDSDAAEPHARVALDLAEQVGRPSLLASALADVAFLETISGRGVPTALIERALELDAKDEWRSMLGLVRPAWIHGMLLMWVGDLAAARAVLESLRDGIVAQGDDHSLTYVSFHLARVECLAGNWELAARYADECAEMAAQTGQEDERPFALTIRALVAAHLGRVDEVRAATDEGLPLALEFGVAPAHFEMLAIRGFLEHSVGDAREADRFLGRLRRAAADAGFREPARFRFHGDAIETLLALGEHDAAAEVLDELEAQARAAGRVWAHTIASRSRALLDAAAGDIDAALAGVARALELHEELEEPFERGRTLLVLGVLQRRTRQKRAARDSLLQALAIFDRLGARLWAQKAQAELGRIGGRAAAPGTLTPTEDRIAGLVAAGHTYREVADALFISPKTVQWNLSKIYRKLGVRSRAELAAKLAAEQTPAVPPVPE